MINSKFIITKDQMADIIKEYYECDKVEIKMYKKKDYDWDGDFCGYNYIPSAKLTKIKEYGKSKIEIISEVDLNRNKLRDVLKNIIDNEYEIVSIHVSPTVFTVFTHEKEMILRRK